MAPLVKTTGSSGVHVYVPIKRGPTAEARLDVRQGARSRRSAAKHPKLLTSEYRIADRPKGRVLVDYNQNAWGRTLASIYSARPKKGASVSTPVTWREGRARHRDRGLHHPQRSGTREEARRPLEAAARGARPLRPGARAVDAPPRAAATRRWRRCSSTSCRSGREWQYEPKWDGFRCIAFRDGAKVDVMSKAGSRSRAISPELVEMLRQVRAKRFVLDGEIVVPKGRRALVRRAPPRIHPAASRIKLLSTESPASLIVFDLLVDAKGKSLVSRPLAERRAALEAFVAAEVPASLRVKLSPATTTMATVKRWFRSVGGGPRRRDRRSSSTCRISPVTATACRR
jgi:hypothetical protein